MSIRDVPLTTRPAGALVRALRDVLIAPADGDSRTDPDDRHAAAGVAADGRESTPRVAPERRRRGFGGRFVADAPAHEERAGRAGRVVASAVPREVALLCAAEDARALGVAAAAVLVRRARAACALAAVWSPIDAGRRIDRRPPASPAARRLAGALAARGLHASAAGRVATLALPHDPAEAVAAARRAAAACHGPVVLAIGGPRDERLDALLAEQDLVLLLSRPRSDPAVAALALGGLPAGVAARSAHVVGLGVASRRLAEAGLMVPAALRRALDERVSAGAVEARIGGSG